MECGHAFCDDCWRQHLTIQVTDGNAKRLPCMGVKCGVICDETKVSNGSRTLYHLLDLHAHGSTPLPCMFGCSIGSAVTRA